MLELHRFGGNGVGPVNFGWKLSTFLVRREKIAPIDDDNELKRLRRELQSVTAERDRLLAENRRLRHEFDN